MERQIVKIKGKAAWEYFRAKGGNWIAVCDALGLTVQSGTWSTLLEDINNQTLNAMFLDLLESHDLERFLRDRGWHPVGRIPLKPANISFEFPFDLREIDRDRQVAVR